MAGQFSWARGHYRRGNGYTPDTQTAQYRLSNLIDRGLIGARQGQAILDQAGLRDFVFQLTWAEDFDTPDDLLERHLEDADGFVVFVHGWTGNYKIWEKLPDMVVTRNRKLVTVAVDHNGFGNSRFVDNLPDIDNCNPPAAMRTLQKVINLLNFRRQPGNPKPRVINFVGHSMGGATLFYLNPMIWSYGEVTRYALAPALLLADELHRAFYTTLGTGINLLQRVPMLEFVERAIQPRMIDILCNGASDFVKREHTRQYRDTPRGITGATFRAMGLLQDSEIAHDYQTFRVILGHKDNLVGLIPMIDLLGRLEFPVANIRVVPGSHYMFSVRKNDEETDNSRVYQHVQSREVICQDILDLHDRAYDMQRRGRIYGAR
jgi:hypothetical protein